MPACGLNWLLQVLHLPRPLSQAGPASLHFAHFTCTQATQATQAAVLVSLWLAIVLLAPRESAEELGVCQSPYPAYLLHPQLLDAGKVVKLYQLPQLRRIAQPAPTHSEVSSWWRTKNKWALLFYPSQQPACMRRTTVQGGEAHLHTTCPIWIPACGSMASENLSLKRSSWPSPSSPAPAESP